MMSGDRNGTESEVRASHFTSPPFRWFLPRTIGSFHSLLIRRILNELAPAVREEWYGGTLPRCDEWNVRKEVKWTRRGRGEPYARSCCCVHSFRLAHSFSHHHSLGFLVLEWTDDKEGANRTKMSQQNERVKEWAEPGRWSPLHVSPLPSHGSFSCRILGWVRFAHAVRFSPHQWIRVKERREWTVWDWCGGERRTRAKRILMHVVGSFWFLQFISFSTVRSLHLRSLTLLFLMKYPYEPNERTTVREWQVSKGMLKEQEGAKVGKGPNTQDRTTILR